MTDDLDKLLAQLRTQLRAEHGYRIAPGDRAGRWDLLDADTNRLVAAGLTSAAIRTLCMATRQ